MSGGGSCPYCSSPCIGHTMEGKGVCLDCDKTWVIGGRNKTQNRKKRRTNAEARRIINQRNHR